MSFALLVSMTNIFSSLMIFRKHYTSNGAECLEDSPELKTSSLNTPRAPQHGPCQVGVAALPLKSTEFFNQMVDFG